MFTFGTTAPEFKNIKGWINSKPLTLRELRGRVVLLDFWTYSCVNCVRSIPHLKELNEKYSDVGLIVIGVHTPEFGFEKDAKNVEAAVEKFGIKYPVALDSDNTTWHLYGNRYWPKQELIDARGILRYDHAGEGGYAEIEENIIQMLKETGMEVITKVSKLGRDEKYKAFNYFAKISPETYTGSARSHAFGNSQVCVPGSCIHFIDRGDHDANKVYLDGDWTQEQERIRHPTEDEAYVLMKYSAKQVNVVLSPYSGGKYKVFVYMDGKPLQREQAGRDIKFMRDGKSFVQVEMPEMFEIVDTQSSQTHEIKLVSDSPEFTLYTFTFG